MFQPHLLHNNSHLLFSLWAEYKKIHTVDQELLTIKVHFYLNINSKSDNFNSFFVILNQNESDGPSYLPSSSPCSSVLGKHETQNDIVAA